MELTWKDIDRFMTVAAASLDRDWLNKEMEKIECSMKGKRKKNPNMIRMMDIDKRFHPLAYRIYRASQTLARLMKSDEPWETTEDIMKLVHLGRSISVLKEKNVNGLDERIKSLMSDNFNLCDKTTFELHVAATYCMSGHSVEFIDTHGGKFGSTPEMLIDNAIEVECKKKDARSERDRKNRAIWKTICEHAYTSMDKHEWNYLIFIRTQKDLCASDQEFLTGEIDRIIATRQHGSLMYADRGIQLDATPLLKKGEVTKSGIPDATMGEEFDEIMTSGKTMTKLDGKTLTIDYRAFAYRCLDPPDRVKSVVKSVKDAAAQFSGQKPAIIYVNLNTIYNSMRESDYRRLDSMINDILRNNTKINAVVVVAEFLNKMQGGVGYEHRTRIVKNTNPKQPLPPNFQIIGDPV